MAASVWLLVGFSALAWWRVMPPSALPSMPHDAHQPVPVSPDAVAAWLGSASPESGSPSSFASRYELRGVIVQAGAGVALVSVDGRPARPYRVGSIIEDGVVLRAVHGRHAELELINREPTRIALEMPEPPRAGPLPVPSPETAPR